MASHRAPGLNSGSSADACHCCWRGIGVKPSSSTIAQAITTPARAAEREPEHAIHATQAGCLQCTAREEGQQRDHQRRADEAQAVADQHLYARRGRAIGEHPGDTAAEGQRDHAAEQPGQQRRGDATKPRNNPSSAEPARIASSSQSSGLILRDAV